MNWQPISTAPTDGRPIWARGDNYGDPARGQHYCWAWWDSNAWKTADHENDPLVFLTEWLPYDYSNPVIIERNEQ